MKSYKHYSFDLWMTLIKSNPSFKKQRADYFFANYNPLKKTVEEVVQVFRHVDLMCNAINEKTGGNIAAEEMYLMVIYQLSGMAAAVNAVDPAKLYSDMEQLVFENMPLLYSLQTAEVLAKIKSNKENTLSILSNTAFIKGATLRTVLKHLQVDQYVDFELYSDEAGFSKPHPEIFKLMLNQVRTIRKEQLPAAQVVHIGDNVVADIDAAVQMGMGSFQINSNQQLITDLLK